MTVDFIHSLRTSDFTALRKYFEENPRRRNEPFLNGKTILQAAAEMAPDGHPSMVEFLVKTVGCKINAKVRSGPLFGGADDCPTVMHAAAQRSAFDCTLVDWLDAHGANWEMTTKRGRTADTLCKNDVVRQRIIEHRIRKVKDGNFAKKFFIKPDGSPTVFLTDSIQKGFLPRLYQMNSAAIRWHFKNCRAIRREACVPGFGPISGLGYGAMHSIMSKTAFESGGDLVDLLAELGCDPDVVSTETLNYGATATMAHQFGLSGYQKMEELLKRWNVNWHIENSWNQIPRDVAASLGKKCLAQAESLTKADLERLLNLPDRGLLDAEGLPSWFAQAGRKETIASMFTLESWAKEGPQAGVDLRDKVLAGFKDRPDLSKRFLEAADIAELARAIGTAPGEMTLKVLKTREQKGRGL